MPVAVTGPPLDVKVDVTGKFVFAAMGSAGVVAFTINTSTGALTQVGTPNTQYVGGLPNSLAVEKTGRYLYATDGVNGVEVFGINATTGALTALAVSPIAAQANPSAAATDPSGTFLYVANRDANNISAYAILGNGLLSEISGSPFASGTQPQAVGVDPTGAFVYVANNGGGISEYKIENAISGKLISAGTASSGANPSGIAFK
jgi:6-phosphogluconolactonase (cycloisomerase 2 family)